MTRRGSLFLALVIGGAPTAGAQVCVSRAPFAVGRIHGGGGFASPSSGKTYSAELAIGSVRHVFGSLAVSRSIADEPDVTTTTIDARIGYQIAVSPGGTVSVCPFAGFGAFKATSKARFVNSVDTAVVEQRDGPRYELGIAVGKRWTATETLDVLPSLAFARVGSLLKTTAIQGNLRASDGMQSESHELLTAGVGFLIERRFTITPFAALPLGLSSSRGHFGFMATVSFGPQVR